MNIPHLVEASLAFITPFLPYLLKAGEGMAENITGKLGEEVGKDTWKLAKKIWGKISFKNNEDVENTIKKAKVVAENPEERLYQDVLAKALTQQLEKDADLVTALKVIIDNNSDILQSVSLTNTKAGNISQSSSRQLAQKVSVVDSEVQDINQEQ